MTLAMISLAGIPPLAGFFGKFLLFKAVIEQGTAYYWLTGVAIVGVVISLYYYFGVIRAIYWSQEPADLSPLAVSVPLNSLSGAVLRDALPGSLSQRRPENGERRHRSVEIRRRGRRGACH